MDGYRAAGWYWKPGDPPGTQRYWDGELWQGEPHPVAVTGQYQLPVYPDNSQATLALILALGSIFVLPLFAPVGLFVAHKEVRGINTGRRDPAHRTMARIARVICGLMTVFMLLVLMLFGFFGAVVNLVLIATG